LKQRIFTIRNSFHMSESKFSNLPQDALVDLLLHSTRELLEALNKPNNQDEINGKKKQTELLHSLLVRMLIDKKASEQPGIALSY
jgi:hypothetical protein